MSSSSKLPSPEVGDGHILNCSGSHSENEAEGEDVDEEEDVDFNPFLKESPSLEASSSLSSDIEILDAEVTGQGQDHSLEDADFGEEIVTEASDKESELVPSTTVKKRKSSLISQPEIETFHEGENYATSGTDVATSNMAQDTLYSWNRIMDTNDDEEAICKRTRARYSLASFTLDELETFLQETDDEDDLHHNVDDEEEYRKFLAAVLQDGNDDCQTRQDTENVEEEDEENDADFELELEEALESDVEENYRGNNLEDFQGSRRPETRLNRRRKACSKEKIGLSGRANNPLRPLLPNTPAACFRPLLPETAPRFLSIPGYSFVSAFTPNQLGQLHCLIHEHVQLLIQVFSICVLDPSRQHIAPQVKDLMLEMLKTREQVSLWKRAQYPFFCSFPPYTLPSVSQGHTQCSTGNNSGRLPHVVSPARERCGYAFNRQENGFQNAETALWVPYANGPIVSVLDVAPLNLVGKFMDEVSVAVQEYQQKQIQSDFVTQLKNEPLFPCLNPQYLAEVDAEVVRGSTEDEPTKKTFAASLVERAKKQSIAFVPKEITRLAQRFLPIFNPVLFPHKPPPAAVTNRVLFTDAEDELLAVGLMEYNSDWKAIQQRFLPCKSKHQIFVRQKNRSSSKAPDNPIKVVRRMKSSPLTKEEIARIQEGLKVFKLDWNSVWRYVVPHRDPSLLPRQWRIAMGTQRSYKLSADKKEKRKLSDLNRRRSKPATSSWQTSSEKEECQTDNAGRENNGGDECMGNEDETYVHEAFLADWRPVTSAAVSSPSLSSLLETSRPPCGFLSSNGSHVTEQTKSSALTNPVSSASGTSRHGKPQLAWQPYRSRTKNNAHLVKLAPDLPPVNLPASVRVMSQIAFESSKRRKEIPVKSSSRRSNPNQHPGESPVLRDKHIARDKNQSDLQLHPLLFQPSGDPRLPYYPLSCGNTTSSFNLLSHFQPQLNLNLFCSPHLANPTANHLIKSSKRSASAVGIDFHPLLQKIDDVTTNSITGDRLSQVPANTETLRSSSPQLQDQDDAVNIEPWADNSFPSTFTESSRIYEKANELDLDIHLSLSRQENAFQSRDVDQCSEHSPSASVLNRICDRLNSGVRPMAASSDSISVHGINIGDQSLPGIVMEQEELSDSEEDIGEHVEFECEEMEDSEGDEGSDSEHMMDLQNKKLPNSKTEVAAEEKEKRSDSLSLHLNSFRMHKSKAMCSVNTDVKHFTGKISPASRPSRSCKKLPSFQKHLAGITQQEEKRLQSNLAVNPSKGPTKRSHRKNASGVIVRRSRKGDLDLNIEHRSSPGSNTCQSEKVHLNLNNDVHVEMPNSL